MTFFERVESLRKAKKISQGKLEKELGFSNGSISKWKTSMPTPERLQKIADYFGVSIKYLMTGGEESEQAFLAYLDSLGYRIYRDDPEHKPTMSSENISSCRLKYDTLSSLKLLIDSYAKATVDAELLSLKEEEIRQERLEKERTLRHLRGENIYEMSQFEKDWNKAHLEPQAAHERTDIEVTDEMRKRDDDIMDDDDFWNK